MSNILLKIENIKKEFISIENKAKIKIEALKGISIYIYEGEIISLLGQNGAGKTTLLSIIATLHPATSGDILFKDNSIYKNIKTVLTFRRNLGYCPQKANFEPGLTVEEILIFSGRYFNLNEDLIKKRVMLMLEKFDLYKYKKSDPNILSGGYRQRLLIARALIHDPKLLILDEPTIAMDPEIRRNLWQEIITLKKQGITILLTTHYLDEAETLSDRVAILDKGLIKVTGTPRELKKIYNKAKLEEIYLNILQKNKEA